MSDGDSIIGAVTDTVKDLGKETLKQIVGTPGSVAKGAGGQILNKDNPEEEAKKAQLKAEEFARIRAIEAEMAQIRQQNDQKNGPQVEKTEDKKIEALQKQNGPKIDEASRQAVGRAEQGRNFKG